MKIPHSIFETELQVRPDDIDMNQHVHASTYIDYVLAARFDQMERCYGMSMNDFHDKGFNWLVASVHLDYKRALNLGEWMCIRTGVEKIAEKTCTVRFEILKRDTRKLCCSGWFEYVMVSTENGRAATIPDWIVEKYSV